MKKIFFWKLEKLLEQEKNKDNELPSNNDGSKEDDKQQSENMNPSTNSQQQAQNGKPQQEGEEQPTDAEPQEGDKEQPFDAEPQEEGEEQPSDAEPQEGDEEQSSDAKPQEEGEAQQYNPFKGMKQFSEKPESLDKGSGFSLDYDGDDVEVPDSIINMLVDRFLNMHFTLSNTDLNRRNNNLIRDNGDLKWNIPDLIRHKVTKDLVKMPYDKYGYRKDDGKGEDIPLSFYIDLSGSMSEYSRLLSLIGIKLMQRKIKILVGYNEEVYYQINSVPPSFSLDLFKELIENEMEYEEVQSDSRYRGVDITEVQRNIDEYLIEKNAKKVVVFTDFDAKSEVERLSQESEVWWFCFEERSGYRDAKLHDFKGHFYNTQELEEFAHHLRNISNKLYEQKQRRMREDNDYERD